MIGGLSVSVVTSISSRRSSPARPVCCSGRVCAVGPVAIWSVLGVVGVCVATFCCRIGGYGNAVPMFDLVECAGVVCSDVVYLPGVHSVVVQVGLFVWAEVLVLGCVPDSPFSCVE